MRGVKHRKVTPEKLAAARQMYLIDGMSWAIIAPLVGLSVATLRRNLDCSRSASEALELAWSSGRCKMVVSDETRRKLSVVTKRMWDNMKDRSAINRKRWAYMRMMNV